MPLVTLSLTLPARTEPDGTCPLCAGVVETLAESTVCPSVCASFSREDGKEDMWRIMWIVADMPDRSAWESALAACVGFVPALEIETLPDKDWLVECWRGFAPFRVGTFFIHGSHVPEPPPPESIPLLIDAATAFGTGEHGTTRGCLEALLALKDRGFSPKKILDMGTGSGILAIAARKLWPDDACTDILGVDSDPEAVRVSVRHAKANGTPDIRFCEGDGFSTPAVTAGAPYDVIVANILAAPLIGMAPEAASCLSADGVIILSGLLENQGADVRMAYESQGLTLHAQTTHASWQTLLLQR